MCDFRSVAWLGMALLSACAVETGGASGSILVGTEPERVELRLVGPTARRVWTDAAGQWSARDLVPGDYAAIATVADSLERTRTVTFAVAAHRVAEVSPLSFTPVGAVHGRATLEGAPGRVLVGLAGGGMLPTRADGSFDLSDLPAGTREVLFESAGFRSSRVTVEVVRGVVTELADLTLQPLPTAPDAPTTLEGSVTIPYDSDVSGVLVRIEGTDRETHTDVAGRFRFDDVVPGTWALSFRRGVHSVRLPLVLALPGTKGFLVDGALAPLELVPIPLHSGERLSDASSFSFFNQSETWASVMLWPDAQVWLIAFDGRRVLVGAGVEQLRASWFGLGPQGDRWRVALLENPVGNPVVIEVDLRTLQKRVIDTWPVVPGGVDSAAVTSEGIAWVDGHTVWLRKGGVEVVRFAGTAWQVLSLPDDTVAVMHAAGVTRLRMDGSEVSTWPVRWMRGEHAGTLSADGRYLFHYPLSERDRSFIFDFATGTDLASPITLPWDFPVVTSRDGRWVLGRDSSTVLDLETRELALVGIGGETSLRAAPVLLNSDSMRLLVHQPDGGSWITDIGNNFWPAVLVEPSELRVLGHYDPTTGYSDVIDFDLTTRSERVVAEGVLDRASVVLATGAVVSRVRGVGAAAEVSFVRPDRTERRLFLTQYRNSASFWDLARGERRLAGIDVTPFGRSRGWVFDSETEAWHGTTDDLVTARWVGDGTQVRLDTYPPPFTFLSGVYLEVFP